VPYITDDRPPSTSAVSDSSYDSIQTTSDDSAFVIDDMPHADVVDVVLEHE
jgi:hypothetical protein